MMPGVSFCLAGGFLFPSFEKIFHGRHVLILPRCFLLAAQHPIYHLLPVLIRNINFNRLGSLVLLPLTLPSQCNSQSWMREENSAHENTYIETLHGARTLRATPSNKKMHRARMVRPAPPRGRGSQSELQSSRLDAKIEANSRHCNSQET